MDSTLLLGSRRIAPGLLSALSGRSVVRKKETRKMSVIPRLIKTAIFHDSLEFWLSSVGRAYYRGEHSWTPTGETHTSWGMYDALKNGMHLLSCREIIACNAWLSSLGFQSRMNSVRLAKESRRPVLSSTTRDVGGTRASDSRLPSEGLSNFYEDRTYE